MKNETVLILDLSLFWSFLDELFRNP